MGAPKRPRRPRRTSVVTSWHRAAVTLTELAVDGDHDLPLAVRRGMALGAWAQVEGCPLVAYRGELVLHPRLDPSPALAEAAAEATADAVGVLGLGIPVRLGDGGRRAHVSAWPTPLEWGWH